MKLFWQGLALCSCAFAFGVAYAYSLDCDSKGESCKVTCNNGQFVGTMYWNGSKWSDGLRWDTDKNALARKMVEAQGTSCQ